MARGRARARRDGPNATAKVRRTLNLVPRSGLATLASVAAAVVAVAVTSMAWDWSWPVLGTAVSPGRPERTVFQMRDPEGDDDGPGTYRYPGDATFVPGLFDLTSFAVHVGAAHVHFDLTFRAMVNPWNAPEGFYHQLIDVYIDTTPRKGRTEPLRPGPQVRFDPAHGWDVRVRGAPFGGTRLHWAHDEPDAPGQALEATVLGDGRTVRISVPQAVVGPPQPVWRYYVLVGGFDPFGEDNYRSVGPVATQWSFGGGDDAGAGPRVIDLLAPRGWRNQARQLGAFAALADGPVVRALLHPVGPGQTAVGLRASLVALGLLGLAGWVGWSWVRRFRRR